MVESIRVAEVMGALSVATDYAMGQPVDYAMQSCELSLRLGERAGLTDAQLQDVYYQAMLRFIGCNAETYLMAAIFGDEIALRSEFASVDAGDPTASLKLAFRYIRSANEGAPPWVMLRAMVRGLLAAGGLEREVFPGHCEVAQRLGTRLGFGPEFVRGLGQLYARWDGAGVPKIKGEAITLPVRTVMLAQDMVTFHRQGGEVLATKVARERRGKQYDPRLVDLFLSSATSMLSSIGSAPRWQQLLEQEPASRRTLDSDGIDRAIEVLADYADIKSPWTLDHSRRVAQLAEAAARHQRLSDQEIRQAYRAGLLHDIGRVGISAGIWGRTRPLGESEWEKVRFHAYCTDRILARGGLLGQLGLIASAAHERTDASGYFRGSQAEAISRVARLLAASDVYAALTDHRPHRPAYSREVALNMMNREVSDHRLDAEAVEAVLATADTLPQTGTPSTPGAVARPADPVASAGNPYVAADRPILHAARMDPVSHPLTPREVEVLKTLARGFTNKEIARTLQVSPKTIDNQLQSIYQKAGVRTRAGATLYAMEMRLL